MVEAADPVAVEACRLIWSLTSCKRCSIASISRPRTSKALLNPGSLRSRRPNCTISASSPCSSRRASLRSSSILHKDSVTVPADGAGKARGVVHL